MDAEPGVSSEALGILVAMTTPEKPAAALALTGERTLPGIPEQNYWFRRHEVAYLAAVDLVREIGGLVRALDAGCGEGSGTAMLARASSHAIGIDKDVEVIEHCRRMYDSPDIGNLLFVTADLEDPATIPEGPFDLIVALHVLDHLERPQVTVEALASRLADGGGLYAATQNRLLLTAAGHAPNPYIRTEFGPDELTELLHGGFGDVALWGVVHTGELLAAEQEAGAGLPVTLIGAAAAGQEPPVWATSLVPMVTSDDFAFVSDP